MSRPELFPGGGYHQLENYLINQNIYIDKLESTLKLTRPHIEHSAESNPYARKRANAKALHTEINKLIGKEKM